MNNTVEHQKLVDDILYLVGSGTVARVWKNINGLFVPYSSVVAYLKGTKAAPEAYSKLRPLQIGVNGSGDIGGLLNDGTHVEIEVKTGSGRLSKDQENRRDMVEKFNGLYIEARGDEEALQRIIEHLRLKKGVARV